MNEVTDNTTVNEALIEQNAAQAQEICALKHTLELTQQAERMNYDLHNTALSKLIALDKAHDELKEYVNELRDVVFHTMCELTEGDYGDDDGAMEVLRGLRKTHAKTPAQSLAAHDAAIVDKLHIEQAQIEGEVIDRCVISVNEGIMVTKEIVMAREYGDLASTTIALTGRRIKSAIRNMPRKYSEPD